MAHIETGSDEWTVLQEKVSRAGGAIGMAKRRIFYSRSLAKCGKSPVICSGVFMLEPQNIELGNRVLMNRGVYISALAKIRIGNDVLMGPYVHINSNNHRFEDPAVPILDQGKDHKPIVIEDDVWVCASVVITAGSHIGRGSVVMAGAVVSGKVEPYSIIGGVPARFVGRRGQDWKKK